MKPSSIRIKPPTSRFTPVNPDSFPHSDNPIHVYANTYRSIIVINSIHALKESSMFTFPVAAPWGTSCRNWGNVRHDMEEKEKEKEKPQQSPHMR
jgi:hypothetical protein